MWTDHFNPWVYLCISRRGTCDGRPHVALFPQNSEQIFCVCYYGWLIRWCTPAASRPQMWHPEGPKDAAQHQNKWISGEAVYKTAPYLAVQKVWRGQDSPLVDVPFDNLARCWHSFIRVWHFDRRELELVTVWCCCCQQWLQISHRDGGREEERHRWKLAMETHKTPNFSPHLLCLFYFTASLPFIPPVLSDSFIPLFVLQSSQWICIEVPFWVKHFASQRPHNPSKTLTGGGLFFPEKRIDWWSGWAESCSISLTDKMSN